MQLMTLTILGEQQQRNHELGVGDLAAAIDIDRIEEPAAGLGPVPHKQRWNSGRVRTTLPERVDSAQARRHD